MHGGNATGAPIKHGGRSKLWEQLGIGAKAAELGNDEELQSHRENIRLLEGLILAEGDSLAATPKAWSEASDLFEKGVTGGDKAALRDLGLALKAGQDAALRIERLVALMDQQRRHKEAESRREERLASSLSAKQANDLVRSLLAIVIEEVNDPSARNRIGLRLAGIVHPGPGGGTAEQRPAS